MSEQRIVDLESKFSHQDILVEELRQTVHEQFLTIEKLEKNIKALTEQFKSVLDGMDSTPHQKPPHY